MQYVKGKSPQSANAKLLTIYDGVFLRIKEKFAVQLAHALVFLK